MNAELLRIVLYIHMLPVPILAAGSVINEGHLATSLRHLDDVRNSV